VFLGYDYALLDTFKKVQTAFDCKVTVLDNISDQKIIKELEENGITVEPLNKLMTHLKEADVVINNLPVESKYHQTFGYKEFREMNRSSCFINISGFKHIDQSSLVDALIHNKLLGASVDLDYIPDQRSMLYNCDRMVITHNNASFYGLKWIDSLKFLESNLERFAQKESPLGIIDKKSGRHIYKNGN